MIKKQLFTILLGFIPISEVRGAIPYAYLSNLPLYQIILLPIISNFLVPVFCFVFFDNLHKVLVKWNFYKKHIDNFIQKAQKKVDKKISKYGLVGLTLFVAIPLPITGAWTASVGAWVLGMNKKKSIIAIWIGIIIASIVVYSTIYFGSELSQYFTKNI